MLQSKLRQYKSLQVMKAELESVQAELVKFGCDPLTGKSPDDENDRLAFNADLTKQLV